MLRAIEFVFSIVVCVSLIFGIVYTGFFVSNQSCKGTKNDTRITASLG